MLNFEKSIVAEIDNLSSSTKEKTGLLENSIDSNKAKILKLQSIDEAIIRRATTLEISSAELTVKSQQLEVSTGQLQHSANQLSTGLNELQQRTHALEAISSSHGSLIGGLQKATSDIADKLAALAGRETRHFNISIAGFILLLIGIAVIYVVQHDKFGVNDVQIAGLQQTQKDSAVIVGDSLTALDSKIELVSTVLQDEIKKEVALLDYKVQTVKDQAQSVNGRLSQSSPFSQIGDDNIIHGAQWIADLPEENFIVQLAYTDNTDAMYEVAQRYNYYLKESLSYFKANDNGIEKYALLSGNYTTQKQAMAVIDSMPRYIDMQQPLVRKVGVIQKHIAQ